jgi:hypothetical protein
MMKLMVSRKSAGANFASGRDSDFGVMGCPWHFALSLE